VKLATSQNMMLTDWWLTKHGLYRSRRPDVGK